MNICEYGCGKEAHYVTSNKKHCCSSHYNKCEAIRIKKGKAIQKGYDNGSRISPFTNEQRIKSREAYRQNIARKLDEYFVKGPFRCRDSLKRKMVQDLNVPFECKECRVGQFYNNKPITLELHHIDGDKFNNELTNLQILCPNCHSQTPNHRFKNRKKKCPSGGTG